MHVFVQHVGFYLERFSSLEKFANYATENAHMVNKGTNTRGFSEVKGPPERKEQKEVEEQEENEAQEEVGGQKEVEGQKEVKGQKNATYQELTYDFRMHHYRRFNILPVSPCQRKPRKRSRATSDWGTETLTCDPTMRKYCVFDNI